MYTTVTVCVFVPELRSGPLCMDHPTAVYTVRGSDLGADRGERLLRAGSSDFAGHHPSLALTEDGTTPVRKLYHKYTYIIVYIYINMLQYICFYACMMYA